MKYLSIVAILLVAACSGGSGGSGGGGGSKTCHVGPKGGTYTITSGGNKNYSGC